MNTTLSSRPEHNEAPTPHTLGTLAAALVTCKHPEAAQVLHRAGAEETRIRWCAACGALRPGEGSTPPWQAPTFTSLLTRKHFDDLALLLHAIGQLNLLVRAHPPAGAPGSPGSVHLRNLRSSLSELARLPIVREIDRFEDAVAQMPRATTLLAT